MLAHTVCTFAWLLCSNWKPSQMSVPSVHQNWQDMAFPSQNIVSSEDLKIASLTDFVSFIQEAPSHASLSLSAILLNIRYPYKQEKFHWNHDHI
jgi:hypothetical protein